MHLKASPCGGRSCHLCQRLGYVETGQQRTMIEDGDRLQLDYLTDERKARCTYRLLTTGVSLADHGRIPYDHGRIPCGRQLSTPLESSRGLCAISIIQQVTLRGRHLVFRSHHPFGYEKMENEMESNA
jgi:hypothetical protein